MPFLTVIFHKVVQQHAWGVAKYLNTCSLQIYCRDRQWKKWKSVSIRWSYGQEFSVLFYDSRCNWLLRSAMTEWKHFTEASTKCTQDFRVGTWLSPVQLGIHHHWKSFSLCSMHAHTLKTTRCCSKCRRRVAVLSCKIYKFSRFSFSDVSIARGSLLLWAIAET